MSSASLSPTERYQYVFHVCVFRFNWVITLRRSTNLEYELRLNSLVPLWGGVPQQFENLWYGHNFLHINSIFRLSQFMCAHVPTQTRDLSIYNLHTFSCSSVLSTYNHKCSNYPDYVRLICLSPPMRLHTVCGTQTSLGPKVFWFQSCWITSASSVMCRQ